MCAEGKTLIDSYSHQLKRLQLLAVAEPEEVEVAFSKFEKKYEPLISNIKNVIKRVLAEPKPKDIPASEYKLWLLTELDRKLKTKDTNFYDINLTASEKIEFNEFLKKIFTPERLERMEQAQAVWTTGGYVLDSKDGRLYPVEGYTFNVSKKREFYGSDKKLTPYRINVHNTRAKGGRGATLRGERYLADGEYTEANRRMKEIGLTDKTMHADHFVPLALGGIHDARNLQPLPGIENIYKKHKLTIKAFELLKQDITHLSRQHHAVFNRYKDEGLEVVQEALRDSVNKAHRKILAMDEDEKIAFLQKKYPTYKESQIRRIIRKHFTADDNQPI